MIFLINFLRLLCDVLTIAIFLRAVLSWFSPGSTNLLSVILYRVTEPILAPLRRILPRTGGLDFAPVVAIILLQLVEFLLL
ncbi:MAG: YggT family protein [Dehalococcoidales bacterium]|nr:YggT family protein [Dehalococcoidales bacterium]